MSNSISRLWSSGTNLIQRGRELGRAVQHEVSAVLENPDTTVIGRLGQAMVASSPAQPGNKAAGSILFRRALKDTGLTETQRDGLSKLLSSKQWKDCASLRVAIERELGAETAARLSDSPNLLPCLLTERRQFPPLKFKQRLAFDASSLKGEQINFSSHQGKLFASVTTSLNQLLGENPRARQIADDYASADIPMKLTIPLGEGQPQDCQQLPLAARRQLVMAGLRNAPGVTTMVHGFQSTKEIWDSTEQNWIEPGFVGLACDGFGSGGQARSDASAPYTPKQYAFQILETLDALGILGSKQLHVVGHSMGGAATGEMAVALNKAGYTGEARFLMMAPACSSDHLPVFQGHRDLVDVVNAVLIGGIYVPMGALQWTAPLVDWTDRKFPEMSRWMADYGLGLKDSPEHIRLHNADYYRTSSPEISRNRRSRSFEAMMGMATQSGLDPKELRQAAQKFGIFTVHFGADRLVSPEATRRLKVPGAGSMTVAQAGHNACFNPAMARRILERSQGHFERG